MSESKESCACSGSTKLIFACSGAADVGKISDEAARTLTQAGVGKMYCLAGIGGNVSGIVETTKAADKLLVIDGCSIACAKKLLERNGFTDFEYIDVTGMGYEKGQSPATDDTISTVVEKGKELLAC